MTLVLSPDVGFTDKPAVPLLSSHVEEKESDFFCCDTVLAETVKRAHLTDSKSDTIQVVPVPVLAPLEQSVLRASQVVLSFPFHPFAELDAKLVESAETKGTHVIRCSGRSDPLAVLTGIKTSGLTSILLPSYSLDYLGGFRSRVSSPVALHVAALNISDQLTLEKDFNKALSYAVANTLVTVSSGISPTEMEDMVHFTQLLAVQGGRAALHFFDGTDADGSLIADFDPTHRVLSFDFPKSLNEFISVGLSEISRTRGKVYSPFEVYGNLSSSTIVVTYASSLANLTSTGGVLSSFGIISVRIPNPFNHQQFVAALSNFPNIERLFVYDGSSDALNSFLLKNVRISVLSDPSGRATKFISKVSFSEKKDLLSQIDAKREKKVLQLSWWSSDPLKDSNFDLILSLLSKSKSSCLVRRNNYDGSRNIWENTVAFSRSASDELSFQEKSDVLIVQDVSVLRTVFSSLKSALVASGKLYITQPFDSKSKEFAFVSDIEHEIFVPSSVKFDFEVGVSEILLASGCSKFKISAPQFSVLLRVVEKKSEQKKVVHTPDVLYKRYLPASPSEKKIFSSKDLLVWSQMFPTAFGSSRKLFPSSDGVHSITCSVNTRLTPSDYDRNVFHLEFDCKESGLKYEIGEALGVYGENDPVLVKEFIEWYKLEASALVKTRKDGLIVFQTVEQLLVQQLDIFGRPSKRFYASLAELATDVADVEKLQFLTSQTGAEEYKLRVEQTITFADVLREFPSAKPSIEKLSELIPPIKPRHYSIASSQKVHPHSVHLLVVLVSWTDKFGRERFGQCTRFLRDLKVGTRVVASIKPSVMKLPPLTKQPVIMAGLGTGMAPFRAFIQEREWQRAQGLSVGPVVLYFGSRNRSKEYLYGEELEAYHKSGLLSHLRLAFSRDQPEKVYIQHKISEDSKILSKYLLEHEGCFYLCGPTWPAGDVKDAIIDSFVGSASLSVDEANEILETLKEKGRYILEVY